MITQNKKQTIYGSPTYSQSSNDTNISSSSSPYLQPQKSSFELSPSTNLIYPTFNPILHLNYRNTNLIKSIDAIELLNINNDEHTLEMIGDGSFPLFTQSCIEIMKWELLNYINSKNQSSLKLNSCFESPKLKDCKDILPFVYEAWTNPETSKAISAISGFDLKTCLDYEIAHFAKHSTKKHRHQLNVSKYQKRKMNGRANDPLILRKKSIAYPYICLVKMFSSQSLTASPNIAATSPESRSNSTSSFVQRSHQQFDSSLPEGYAVVLQGRLTENMAYRTLPHYRKKYSSKSTGAQFNIMLCATFQPVDLIKYEDLKFLNSYTTINNAQKLLCDSNYLTKSKKSNDNGPIGEATPAEDRKVEDYNDFDGFDQYKSWLDGLYSGKSVNPPPSNGTKSANTNANIRRNHSANLGILQGSINLKKKRTSSLSCLQPSSTGSVDQKTALGYLNLLRLQHTQLQQRQKNIKKVDSIATNSGNLASEMGAQYESAGINNTNVGEDNADCMNANSSNGRKRRKGNRRKS
ncbi:hypothetical protein CANARDRAFT_6483 [[Candida] arabinofermentans NRRL YB-2248]|uniref:Uncharacterized protein n=1 Tax=[Candida] arabinofermentans NRRL YB-2248 TaxID=983967 RepID=A0A1E4T578_9ASCO|nr:hypothetical protein CANARDRAFT_6483 [[Candida] arabinofermentans NRRL YB-2248]